MAGKVTFQDTNELISRGISGLYARIFGVEVPLTAMGTLTNVVWSTGDQTISGNKTFAGNTTFAGGVSGGAITGSNLVYNTGNQDIQGIKTFKKNARFAEGMEVTGDAFFHGNFSWSPDSLEEFNILGVSSFWSTSIFYQGINVTAGGSIYLDSSGDVNVGLAKAVLTTGTQTISGIKSFPNGISGAVVTGSNLVYNTGNQTISGAKTFTSGISAAAVTGANLIYNTGDQSISGDKTFAGTLRASSLFYVNNSISAASGIIQVQALQTSGNTLFMGEGNTFLGYTSLLGGAELVGTGNRVGAGDYFSTDTDFAYIRRGTDNSLIFSTEENCIFGTEGNISIDFGGRSLIDIGGLTSVSYAERKLYDDEGTVVLRWDLPGEIYCNSQFHANEVSILDNTSSLYSTLKMLDGDLAIGDNFSINLVGAAGLEDTILELATGAGTSYLKFPPSHTGVIATREYIASGISGHPINTIPSFSVATGNQLSASNNGQTILVNPTGTGTLIIVPSGLPAFFTAMFIRGCSGIPTFSGRAGVTIHNPYGDYTMPVSGCRVSIVATGTNAYNIV